MMGQQQDNPALQSLASSGGSEGDSLSETVQSVFINVIGRAGTGRQSPISFNIVTTNSISIYIALLYRHALAVFPNSVGWAYAMFMALIRMTDCALDNKIISNPPHVVFTQADNSNIKFGYDAHRRIKSIRHEDMEVGGRQCSLLIGLHQASARYALIHDSGVLYCKHCVVVADDNGLYWFQTPSGSCKLHESSPALITLQQVSLAVFLSSCEDKPVNEATAALLVTGLMSKLDEVQDRMAKGVLGEEDVMIAIRSISRLHPAFREELEDELEDPKDGVLNQLVTTCEAFSCAGMSIAELANYVHAITQVPRLITIVLSLSFYLPKTVLPGVGLHSATEFPIESMSIDEVPPNYWVLQESQKPAHSMIRLVLTTPDLMVFACAHRPTLLGNLKRKAGKGGKGGQALQTRGKPIDHMAVQARFFQSLRNGIAQLTVTPIVQPAQAQVQAVPALKTYNLFE